MKKSLILILSLFCLSAFSQEEWELIHGSTDGISIGNVFMTDSNHIWGTGGGGSVYFSGDGGYTWDLQYQHEDYQFSDIYFPDNQTGWVVGWSEVLKTDDGGQSWTLQSLPNPLGLDVEAVYFINADTGWIAGSYKTIYVTYDGGNLWTSQHNYNLADGHWLYDIQFYDANHGCAVGGGIPSDAVGVIMTTEDGGTTWTDITPGYYSRYSKVQYTSEYQVWTCDYNGKILKSLDRGFTWEQVNQVYLSSFNDMYFSNENEAIISGGYFRMACTEDGWNTYQFEEIYVYNMTGGFSFSQVKNGIACGYNNLLRTSDGGQTWHRLNDRFIQVAFFTPSNGWLMQEYLNKNLLHSTDGGFTWKEVITGQKGTFQQMDFISDQIGFALTDEPELLKTVDAGASWEVINLPFDSSYFSDLFFVDENIGFICSRPNTLYKTVNGGLDWSSYSFDTLNYISSVDFFDAENGWIVGSQGFAARTNDGGDTWKVFTLSSWGLVDIDFINPYNGFIISNSGEAYRTRDGGVIWEPLGLSIEIARSVQFTDTLNGWITGENEVFRTYDGGDTWYQVLDNNSGIFQHEFTGFFALDTNNAWLCSMDGRVYSLSGLQSEIEIDKKELFNIFPNPVFDRLTVEINAPDQDFIMISIFSVDGRLLMSKQHSTLNQKSLIVDLSGLSTGLYLLNCQSSTFSESYKIVKK